MSQAFRLTKIQSLFTSFTSALSISLPAFPASFSTALEPILVSADGIHRPQTRAIAVQSAWLICFTTHMGRSPAESIVNAQVCLPDSGKTKAGQSKAKEAVKATHLVISAQPK